MQIAIAVAVMGAIALIVFASVTPTLFGSFGQTYQQTQAACVHQGERFTAINTQKDWTGTDVTVSSGSGGKCAATTASTTLYTPNGVAVTVASNLISSSGAKWEAALAIMTEQGGINRLVITILPLLTILGAIYMLYNWHKGRSAA